MYVWVQVPEYKFTYTLQLYVRERQEEILEHKQGVTMTAADRYWNNREKETASRRFMMKVGRPVLPVAV